MAKYTVISDVGNAIVKVLRNYLVPDIVPANESIGVCTPADRGDIRLGIYLYDVVENGDYRDYTMRSVSAKKQTYPSTYLSLHYMITAYSDGDVKYRSLEEHRILGKVIQVLSDHSVLDEISLEITNKQQGFDLRIELERIPPEDKIKLWPSTDTPYRLSLFYKVVPIEIESALVREITRVSEVDIAVEEKEQMGK